MKNMVAKILEVYAWLNGVCGLILSIILSELISGWLCFLFAGMVVVVSFLIYSLAEIIELLYQIKINTEKNSNNVINDNNILVNDELPEI